MTRLLQRLSMIPRVTATAGKAECIAQNYAGWELLEVDEATGEILICRPSPYTSEYTKSKNLLILCGEAATLWRRNMTAAV